MKGPNMSGTVKFVILSDSRSGTSLLSETLNSHPQIVCHGEVFHPTPRGHIKIREEERTLDQLVALREQDPVSFMRLVYDRPGAQAVGFKMWRNQNSEECDRLMADDSVAKIIYERTNILARFASSRLVKATGIYNLAPGAARPARLESKITFDRAEFDKYRARHERIFSTYRQNSRGPVLELTYKSLVEKGFDEVLSFLGAPLQPLAPQKEKLHDSRIIERFESAHHPLIVSTVTEMGCAEWLDE
ncbi:sulfotransferase [Paracoccus sp. MBLB3053]|uniref:Sulfotransferase n=1 Tax=Paracoccus aurantius TaxID=3073814 RepID=A0ABU2HV77_9RHOB|nr:sulfotransferase [Paracoccus sp. MBLB3053]MDS9468647.1 sulfotransferase [Paracoccus sp. MBLB3053]